MFGLSIGICFVSLSIRELIHIIKTNRGQVLYMKSAWSIAVNKYSIIQGLLQNHYHRHEIFCSQA